MSFRFVTIALILSLASGLIVQGSNLGCFSGLSELFRRKDPRTLADFNLARERKSVDEDEMYKAYEEADRKLRNRVDHVDLKTNMDEIELMLLDELNSKSCSDNSNRRMRFCKKQQVAAERSLLSDSISSEVAVNALIRLMELRDIPVDSKVACTRKHTLIMEENNRIARDPIGRQIRDGKLAAPLERVGHLIFEVARKRAQTCLPTYIEDTSLLKFVQSLKERRMRSYLDRVLEHRRQKLPELMDAGETFDKLFGKSPQKALAIIQSMPNGLEEDEVGIVLSYFEDINRSQASLGISVADYGPDRRPKWFDMYIVEPCRGFVDALREIYVPLDFDLKLRNFVGLKQSSQRDLVYRYDSDAEFYKQRAHYSMCQKLINEKQRFIEYLSYETSVD